jgi:hypothetical protein
VVGVMLLLAMLKVNATIRLCSGGDDSKQA